MKPGGSVGRVGHLARLVARTVVGYAPVDDRFGQDALSSDALLVQHVEVLEPALRKLADRHVGPRARL